jgi:hypothetical protein
MTKKQVEIYRCDVCGQEVEITRCVRIHFGFVCDDCIEHPELVEERLQRRAVHFEENAAYFEEMAAHCQRNAANARAMIGKLEQELADLRAAMEAAAAEEAAAAAAEAEDIVNGVPTNEAQQEGFPA